MAMVSPVGPLAAPVMIATLPSSRKSSAYRGSPTWSTVSLCGRLLMSLVRSRASSSRARLRWPLLPREVVAVPLDVDQL